MKENDQPQPDHERALLEVTKSIVSHRDLSELLRNLTRELPRIIPIDSVVLLLHDDTANVMRVLALETAHALHLPPNAEIPMAASPSGWVWQHQELLIVTDDQDSSRFGAVKQTLRKHGIQSYGVFPLTASQRRLGAMGFGSTVEHAFRHIDLSFVQRLVDLVAVAVENTLNRNSMEAAERHLTRERDYLSTLLEVNNAVASHLNLKDLFIAIFHSLRRVLGHEGTSIHLYNADRQTFRLQAFDFPDGQAVRDQDMERPINHSPAARVILSQQPILFSSETLNQFSHEDVTRLAEHGLKSGCCLPLVSRGKLLGVLTLASKGDAAFVQADLTFLTQVANQIAIALERSMAYEEIAELKRQLEKEKVYLEEEIRAEHDFEDIIGDSPSLRHVLKQIATVAPIDSTVLIHGETGTGKELVARAIHDRSTRKQRTFVKLNCAAIPAGLLESELFGHEKGAFTGAITQKIGRFELAHQGTIFLDEVGEIPPELQAKLLRVLQEQEFERLGSARTIRVDIRVIAATNRDLISAVEEKQFRSDLYYRLNVFPIEVPPLRQRKEDIPLLVRHFVDRLSRRMNKRFENIAATTMTALHQYNWPGNIRELANVIERAMILSEGSNLHVPLAELKQFSQRPSSSPATLETAEREHIVRTLRVVNWVIGGPSGAASRLGMKRTTLISKMQKLGIARPKTSV